MFQLVNNMRRIHIIIWIALLGCMGLSACTEQLDEWTTDNRISLSAEVENVMPTARRESYAEPVADNNLTAAVWFSLEPGKYPDGPVNEETNISIKSYMKQTRTSPYSSVHLTVMHLTMLS